MNKFFAVLALPLLVMHCAGSAVASDEVDRVLNEARAECKSFENGDLTIDMDRAVVSVDVTGNGEADEVVDSTAFASSSAASLFCGTGGCGLDVIAEGTAFSFLAKGWSVRAGESAPFLEIGVHWSECDYTSFCFEKFVWTGAAFESRGARVEDPNVVMGLYDGVWVLQDYGDCKVTIEFADDGSLSGQGPCNTYRATHEISYPDIKIGPTLSTRMACADMDEEFAYFEQLAKVDQLRLTQNSLVLIQSDGAELNFKH